MGRRPKGIPKPESPDITIHVKITPSQFDWYSHKARTIGAPLSAWVRQILARKWARFHGEMVEEFRATAIEVIRGRTAKLDAAESEMLQPQTPGRGSGSV